MLVAIDSFLYNSFDFVFGDSRGARYYSRTVAFWRENSGAIRVISAIVLIKLFIVNINIVPSGSMNPNLIEGDIVVVNKILRHFKQPTYGDVVTFSKDKYYVKRVVGLPGDKIQIKQGMLFVNGTQTEVAVSKDQTIAQGFPAAEVLDFRAYESQISGSKRFSTIQLPISDFNLTMKKREALYQDGNYVVDSPVYTVPADQLFLLGDNRPLSNDSRYQTIGFVPIDAVEGYVVTVAFNLFHIFRNIPRIVNPEAPFLPARLNMDLHLNEPKTTS